MTDIIHYENLTFPEVAALPRDIPIVIPLGEITEADLIKRVQRQSGSVSSSDRICVFPNVPFGFEGSPLAVDRKLFKRVIDSLGVILGKYMPWVDHERFGPLGRGMASCLQQRRCRSVTARQSRDDQELAEIRRKEFAAACKILRVTHGVVLDYPDGQLHRQDAHKVVANLTQRIREFRPHVLLTFGPDGNLYISDWGFGPPIGRILKVVLPDD